MRQLLLLVCASALAFQVAGQTRYSVKSGSVDFLSDAPLEVIRARNAEIQGIVDMSNNTFAFKISVRSFKGFNSELQREHFNEKYMESDRYSDATFTGKIIESVDLEPDREYEVRAKGELDIHGVKQSRIIRARLKRVNGSLLIESEFTVPLSDHNITIPSIVNQKIATEIIVTFKATLAERP